MLLIQQEDPHECEASLEDTVRQDQPGLHSESLSHKNKQKTQISSLCGNMTCVLKKQNTQAEMKDLLEVLFQLPFLYFFHKTEFQKSIQPVKVYKYFKI